MGERRGGNIAGHNGLVPNERASYRYGERCIISLIVHAGLGIVSSH